jgi:trigger factor
MMKTTIERLEDNKLRLDVHVPASEVQEAMDATLQMMARDMNLPGFRPGKVPPQAVLSRIGREAVVAETVRYFIDDWYRAAVMASGIRPVAAPEVDFPEPNNGEAGLEFSATVEVAPKPKLPDLGSVEVDRPRMPDVDEYVGQVLEATLRGAGTLKPTGKPAAKGDEVVVDFHCTIDGEKVEGAAAVGYEARLGEGRLLDELEEAILGVEAGKDVSVEVDFEPDHPMPQLAGKHATFHVKVRDVQDMELPELTDEVAKKVSEFDTAAELRADIEGSITKRLQGELDGMFRANAVTKLAEVAELDEPQSLVEQRQQEAYGALKQQLQQAGMSVEAYLDRTGQDVDGLFAELEKSARDDLRRELCLLALAEDAKIEVSEDDLRKEIHEHAEAAGEDPEASFARVMSSGRADMLRGELLIQRTIDYLVSKVKPVDVDPPKPQGEDDSSEGGEGEKADEGGKADAS